MPRRRTFAVIPYDSQLRGEATLKVAPWLHTLPLHERVDEWCGAIVGFDAAVVPGLDSHWQAGHVRELVEAAERMPRVNAYIPRTLFAHQGFGIVPDTLAHPHVAAPWHGGDRSPVLPDEDPCAWWTRVAPRTGGTLATYIERNAMHADRFAVGFRAAQLDALRDDLADAARLCTIKRAGSFAVVVDNREAALDLCPGVPASLFVEVPESYRDSLGHRAYLAPAALALELAHGPDLGAHTKRPAMLDNIGAHCRLLDTL